MAAALAGGTAAAVTSTGSADLASRIAAKSSTEQNLKAQIAAEGASISRTSGGLASAEARLSTLQSEASARESELQTVHGQLIAARDHLVELENRMALATKALAANLVANYEGETPNALTVILQANGFADLLERLSFLRDVANQDQQVVTNTRLSRKAVTREALSLGKLEAKDQSLAQTVLHQRNQMAVLQGALLHQQETELAQRRDSSAQLRSVRSQLGSLETQEAKLEAEQAAAALHGGGPVGVPGNNPEGLLLDPGGAVQAPAGAPQAVDEMIAAGNAIATLPYIWGGGHGSFTASGYDCSGSVSYVLAAAGLLSAPEVAADFESYGDPGPGRWVTIWASGGHVFMYIAGWRFDTVALAETGTRWSSAPGDTAGFVERHPPGL
ncbi:MAG TPA: hypothetical protein VHX88_16945 [Solirubrobacteraceae bacterium]|nr:hypothetical protein [Solirubrobacteraceae bacterium]